MSEPVFVGMSEKVKVWFDPEGDFLEVRFSDAPGFMRETGSAFSVSAVFARGDRLKQN